MVAVPADTPFIIPALPAVATPIVPLVQVPPVVASLRWVEVVGQTFSEPVMVPANGEGLTVTMAEVTAVPQLLVTV